MKQKKSLIAIMSLILVVVVGVTFAYFQSTGTFANVFQTGKYRLVTTEVFESPDNWKPGETIEKTITTKNEGTIPAAVRVSYTEEWFDSEEHDITNSIDEGSAIINFDNQNEWIHENGYYYYKYILNPNDETSSFIKSVTLNEDLDEVACSTEGLTQVCESENPALGAKYVLTITKETVQYDKYHESWNTNVSIIEKPASAITYLTRQVEGQITPGDVIGIGETEDFYVISSNSEKTVLLAKYNLLVGYVGDDWDDNQTVINPSIPGYGLQSIDAEGGYSGNATSNGVLAYSNTNYWMNGWNIRSPYNENNTIYVDQTDRKFKYISDDSVTNPYVYDENSIIYQYINGENGYINRLIEMGAPNTIIGRLLSYEEAENKKNVGRVDIDEDNYKSIIFDGGDYWIGSAEDYDSIYVVVPVWQSIYGDRNIEQNANYGVRPVIEIPTSEIK